MTAAQKRRYRKLRARARKWTGLADAAVNAVQAAKRRHDDVIAKYRKDQATRQDVDAARVVVRAAEKDLVLKRKVLAEARKALANFRAGLRPDGPDTRGAALIAEFEGVYLRPYNDPVGYCTTGIGHLIAYRNCNGDDMRKWSLPSRGAAMSLLLRDLQADYTPQVMSVLRDSRVDVTQGMVNACVSLEYNVGVGGFASSTVARELKAGNKKAAAQGFRLWVKAGGSTLPGLVRRREAEIREFLS